MVDGETEAEREEVIFGLEPELMGTQDWNVKGSGRGTESRPKNSSKMV